MAHHVLQATNRVFYLPHVPGLPPPPKAEERALATALKQLIFGVSSPDVSFARVMCSQTHEKVRHCIVRRTKHVERRALRHRPQRRRPSHCATLSTWQMTVHTLLLGCADIKGRDSGVQMPGAPKLLSIDHHMTVQAGVALRACILAFEDALCPQTCFDILRMAAAVGNQRLLARSGAVALLHFQQALTENRHSLSALPLEALGALLSHDLLQVRVLCTPLPTRYLSGPLWSTIVG